MTTNRTIIGLALVKIGVIPVAGQPHVDQLDMGLTALQEMFANWATCGTFGRLGYVCPQPTDIPEYAPDLTVLRIATTNTTLLYDLINAKWLDLNAFTLDGDCPLGDRGSDGLASCLAERLSEMLAAPMGSITARSAQDFKNKLAYKFGVERDRMEYDFS